MFLQAIPASVAALLKRGNGLPIPDDTFLAGGTAAALYLGHRESIDIDLFTNESFDVLNLEYFLKSTFNYEVLTEKQDTLLCYLDGVKFSLFKYPYRNLEPTLYEDHFQIKIASPLDIVLMKIIAIHQRGEAKDFIDVKSLMERYDYSFPFLTEKLCMKYMIDPNILYQIKRSIVYFDDAERNMDTVVLLRNGKRMSLSEDEWNEVKKFFEQIIRS